MKLLILTVALSALSCSITKTGMVTAVGPSPVTSFCIAPFPPYGGNDVPAPSGGCFGAGVSRAIVDAAIAAQPQDTWGISGHGHAFAQQLPDGSWIIAVNK